MKFNLLERYRGLSVKVKATIWFLICSFLQKGISTITTPIFTRLLSTAEYGQYSVFNSWLGIISIFVTLNLFYGVYTQGLIKFEEKKDIFSSSLLGLTTTLTIIFTVIYLCFHNFWNSLFSLTTVQMLAMFIMIWTSAVFNFWAARQRVEYKYKILVIVTIIVSILKPVVGIIFVTLSNDKVTARILGLVLIEIIGYFWLFIIQMKKGKVFFSKNIWKYALKFNIPLIPHYLSQIVLNNADRIMIKDIVGDNEAGIYSLAYSISQIMTLFNTALMQTLSPWIYKKIKEKKIEQLSNVAYMSLIVIALVNILLIVFAPEIICIFAPKTYYDAIWVIPPVAMSVYFMFAYDLFAKFGFYYEKTNFIMIASIIGAVVNIILNYLFIPIFGYYAAGYTTLICYIIYTLSHYLSMRKICTQYLDGKMPYDTKKILIITFVFLTIGFMILISYNFTVVRYCIIILIIILSIIKRKMIIDTLKKFYALKKSK